MGLWSVGVGQSLASSSPADRSHFHSQVFFQLNGNFGRELPHFLMASNLRPNKTSLCRILTEMARPKVSQRLSTAEYLFSVSSQPLLGVAKFGGGGPRSAQVPRDRDIGNRGFFRRSGILTWPPAKVICTFAGGASAIGGTLASVIGGAPAPRGVVCTTAHGGIRGRPFRKWSYIRSIAWMK